MMSLASIIIAFIIDRLIGEPRCYHPLVIWSYAVVRVEGWLNAARRWQGVLAWLLVVCLPLIALAAVLYLCEQWSPLLNTLLSALCLYVAIGWQSLREHGLAVARALNSPVSALAEGRLAVAKIVSRDSDAMDEPAVIRATIESVLENGADAIFAPLFWFLVAGPLGAIGYRLANTLDAMWGYRTVRYRAFGWFSARVDDGLNILPARLTALSYALLGNTRLALRCWREQAPACASPNGGPVMCAGAGSLAILLGGPASYHGQWQQKPPMGSGAEVTVADIARSIRLLDSTVYMWLLVIVILSVLGVINA